MLDEFKEYAFAKSALIEKAGMSISYDVEIYDNHVYSYSDDEISWSDEDDEEYGEEARRLKEFEDCEVFLVHSCTGDRYLAVFNKANKEI